MNTSMLWTLILGITTLAATSLATWDTSPGRAMDANGLPINDTHIFRISESEKVFDQRESMEERKKGCSPTISCTRAGGYCVKSGKECDGTIDSRGCKGAKKCKCCIPDQTTPAPCPTCPAVTPCSTTTMTTEGTTPSCTLTWLSTGSDRFVRFVEKLSWHDARSLCRSCGLDLYIPIDILAVSKYLDDNFSNTGSKWYWLGGRGNGTHQVWNDGDVTTLDDPWYSSYSNNVGTNDCLDLICHGGWSDKGEVLASNNCDSTPSYDVLCG